MLDDSEKDTELKIPKWYLKLPQNMINLISDMCIALSHVLSRKKKIKTTNTKNVKFYLHFVKTFFALF